MARRAVGGVLAIGVLALLAIVPVAADAASAPGPDAVSSAPAAAALQPQPDPVDTGPLVLLLVAGGLGSMGILAREPEGAPARSRR